MPFSPKFVDLVRNLTTVQGNGPVTLGTAVSGYAGIADALSAGDQFYYCIQGVDKPQEREVGRGTLQADGKVAREAITGGLTNFSSGTKTISLVAAAEWFTQVESGGGAGGQALTVRIDDHGAVNNVTRSSPAAEKTAAAAANFAAWQAAKAAAVAARVNGVGSDGEGSDRSELWYFGVPAIEFGLGTYWFGGNQLTIAEGQFQVKGQGSGSTNNNGASTRLQWDGSCHGLVLEEWSSYSGPEQLAEDASSANTVIAGILFDGGGGALTNSRVGLWMRSNGCQVRDCGFHDWALAGVVVGTRPGMADANLANLCWVRHCNFTYCGTAGIIFDGGDSNAGGSENCSFIYCGRFAAWDSSFLGNKHSGHHSRGIGYGGRAGTTTHKVNVRSIVNHNGYYWGRVPGTDTASDVTAPGTDPAIWMPFLSTGGSADTAYAPNWAAGAAYNGSAAYYADNGNAPSTFHDCYNEADCLGVYMSAPGTAISGLVTPAAPYMNGAVLSVSQGIIYNYTGGVGYYQTRYSASYNNGTVPKATRRAWLGGNAVFSLVDTELLPNGLTIDVDGEGNLSLLSYFAENPSIFRTGPGTTYSFGRPAAVPHASVMQNLFVGGGDNARQVDSGPAAPATGARGKGDMRLNSNAGKDAPAGWRCVTAGTPGSWKAEYVTHEQVVALSDEGTAITAGADKLSMHWPFDFEVVDAFIGLSAVSTSGAVTVDMNKAGASIFSTRPSIEAGEETSLTGTPAAIGTATIGKGDKVTFDIDAAGTGAKGLKIYVIGYRR